MASDVDEAERNFSMALLATITLSLLSTNTGIANKWQPTPNDPKPDPNSPPGDVVIKYPQGAFIIVRCSEQTARYLYFNRSERCHYMIRSTAVYRGLSLISTLFHPFGRRPQYSRQDMLAVPISDLPNLLPFLSALSHRLGLGCIFRLP